MITPSRWMSLGFVWMIALSARAEPPPPAQFGSITYPTQGNIQLDEGTLDLWIVSDFDSDTPSDKSGSDRNWRARLLDIQFPEQNYHYALFYVGWANSYAFAGYGRQQQGYAWMGPAHWKAGETHHVVLTWSGRKRSVFIDGVCQWVGAKGKVVGKDVDVGGELHGDLATGYMLIDGHVTIDEIQIRNIALTPEEIVAAKDAPLAADAHTLLLDHCDGGLPEIAAGAATNQLAGTFDVVDGKFGKAIRLWRKE